VGHVSNVPTTRKAHWKPAPNIRTRRTNTAAQDSNNQSSGLSMHVAGDARFDPKRARKQRLPTPFRVPRGFLEMPSNRRSRRIIWRVVLLFGILGVSIGCVSVALYVLRAGYASSCVGLHYSQFHLALEAYQTAKGNLPPAYIADKNHKPMHSWRVLLLPYLGSQAADLYQRYDFNEPWDGPHNRLLANEMPVVYRCPAAAGSGPYTNYVAVVGPDTAWPGDACVSRKDLQNANALGTTILVVEIAESDIQWLEPRDLGIADATVGVNKDRRRGISSNHPGGAYCLTVDRCHFLPDNTTPDELRALLTIEGSPRSEVEQ
jgi:hypothetical protein